MAVCAHCSTSRSVNRLEKQKEYTGTFKQSYLRVLEWFGPLSGGKLSFSLWRKCGDDERIDRNNLFTFCTYAKVF